MQLLSKNSFIKLLIFLIAFQVLNTSIDTPAENIAISYNYIDTYVEYFAEVVFKLENAFPESGDRQHKELQQHKNLRIKIQNTYLLSFTAFFTRFVENFSFTQPDKYFFTFTKEINPPPEFSKILEHYY